MDVVITVALKDCLFLKTNLYFIEENLKPNHIWIITDRRNARYLPKVDNRVTVLDENALVEGLTFGKIKNIIDEKYGMKNYGWYYQQFLKLGFALSKYACVEYLVWDSDTVPLTNLSFKLNDRDYMLPKKEYHKPYFDTIDRLFYAPKKANFSFISEHMVFNVKIVREMLDLIELNSKKGLCWYEQCIESIGANIAQGFSEFETYGTYCLNYHPGQLVERELRTFRYAGRMYGIFASRKEIKSLSFDLDTVSFEFFDYPISFLRRFKQLFYGYYIRIITKLRLKIANLPY